MTTHNNNNALVLLLAACVCASLFCSISSYISSAFLTPGEKNDDRFTTSVQEGRIESGGIRQPTLQRRRPGWIRCRQCVPVRQVCHAG